MMLNKKNVTYILIFVFFLIFSIILFNKQNIDFTSHEKLSGAVSDKRKSKLPDKIIPSIKLSTNIYDWGKIEMPESRELINSLFVENTGQDTLIIYRIKTDCGCTTYNLKLNSLNPRQKAELKVYISVKMGKFEKKMTIFSNDPNNPEEVIIFKGDIVKKI